MQTSRCEGNLNKWINCSTSTLLYYFVILFCGLGLWALFIFTLLLVVGMVIWVFNKPFRFQQIGCWFNKTLFFQQLSTNRLLIHQLSTKRLFFQQLSTNRLLIQQLSTKRFFFQHFGHHHSYRVLFWVGPCLHSSDDNTFIFFMKSEVQIPLGAKKIFFLFFVIKL